jgi:hypothetical protein
VRGEIKQQQRVAQRRFPPPWSVEDIGAACVVKDSAGIPTS